METTLCVTKTTGCGVGTPGNDGGGGGYSAVALPPDVIRLRMVAFTTPHLPSTLFERQGACSLSPDFLSLGEKIGIRQVRVEILLSLVLLGKGQQYLSLSLMQVSHC